MKVEVLLVSVFGIAMLAGVAGIIGQECEEHHECVGSENVKEYCYEKSRQCVKCTDCKIYFRSNPEHISCVKGSKDCGSCSSGYEEDNLTFGRRDTCIPIPTTGEDYSQFYIAIIFVGILLVLILVAVGFIYFYKVKKDRNQNASSSKSRREVHVESGVGMSSNSRREVDVESGVGMLKMPIDNPPQYEEILPSAPLLPASERENAKRISEEINVKLSRSDLVGRSAPFRYPRSPYNENNDGDGHGGAPDGLHMFFDENTMESDWTPGTGNAQHTSGTDGDDDDDDDGACAYGGVVNAEGAGANIDEVKETDPEEEKVPSETNIDEVRETDPEEEKAPSETNIDEVRETDPEEEKVPSETNIDEVRETDPEEEKAPSETNIDEVRETDPEEEKASSETNINLSDSGVSCQTSTSSLSRPFAQFGSAATSSMEDTRGVTRSHSEDDLSTSGTTNKRQKHDDTLSLDEGTVSDT